MTRYILLGITTATLLVPSYWYVYQRGMVEGEAQYKRSSRFTLTLDSMYFYGMRDGYDACKEGK